MEKMERKRDRGFATRWYVKLIQIKYSRYELISNDKIIIIVELLE